MANLLSPTVQELLKFLFSSVSLVVTLYFWYVRINRERVSIKVYPAEGFQSGLDDHGYGIWSGRIFLANRSILPTAIVKLQVEVSLDGRWQIGEYGTGEGSELPWNMPPTQVFVRDLRFGFHLAPHITREQVYENHRLRLTFETVEGHRLMTELQTEPTAGALTARQAA